MVILTLGIDKGSYQTSFSETPVALLPASPVPEALPPPMPSQRCFRNHVSACGHVPGQALNAMLMKGGNMWKGFVHIIKPY